LAKAKYESVETYKGKKERSWRLFKSALRRNGKSQKVSGRNAGVFRRNGTSKKRGARPLVDRIGKNLSTGPPKNRLLKQGEVKWKVKRGRTV